MIVQYLYEGELSPQMADYIRGAMQTYPNAVELKALPDNDWLNANLPVYTWREKSQTTDGTYERSSQLYCWVSMALDGKSGGFLFLKTAEEKQKIIDGLPDLIANPNPFKTIL